MGTQRGRAARKTARGRQRRGDAMMIKRKVGGRVTSKKGRMRRARERKEQRRRAESKREKGKLREGRCWILK
jgi:hypothetical protein